MFHRPGVAKVIVCGTREFEDYDFVKSKLDFFLKSLYNTKIEIVSGCTRGPDTLAIRYAEEKGYKVWRFPADWKHFGKSAGPVRNTMMADFATHCIAFWDRESTGTYDMIKKAKDNNLSLRVITIDKEKKNG